MELPAEQRYHSERGESAWDMDVGDKKLFMSPEAKPAELHAEDHIQLMGDGHRWELDAGVSNKM